VPQAGSLDPGNRAVLVAVARIAADPDGTQNVAVAVGDEDAAR
jgi:hypothetical protein